MVTKGFIMYYQINNDSGIFVYPLQGKIVFRSHTKDKMNSSTTLATDYFSQLTDCAHEGNLYYAYINTTNQIVVKNQTDILYLSNINYSCNTLPIKLVSFRDQLLLFFCEEIKDNTYNLCFINPTNSEHKYRILHNFSTNAIPHIFCGINNIFIEFCENNISIEYKIMSDLSIEPITDALELRQQSISFNDELADKELEINNLKKIIDSVSLQYNDLMKVAEHYKNEAIKWRSKMSL